MDGSARNDARQRDVAGKLKSGLAARNRRQRIVQGLGLAAILFAFLMLFILVASLASTGYRAVTQTHVEISAYVDPGMIDPERLPRGNFRGVLAASAEKLFPEVTERSDKQKIYRILSNGAQFILRDMIVDDPSLIGRTVVLKVPTSDPFDQLRKGLIDPGTPEEFRRLSDAEIEWFNRLESVGLISNPLNAALLFNADSRFPEIAGLRGAIVGSFWTLLICFMISFPVGIGAAIYLGRIREQEQSERFHRSEHQQSGGGAFGGLRPAGVGSVHRLVRVAAVRSAGRRNDVGVDDSADDHHRDESGIESRACQHSRSGSRAGRVKAAGRVRACASACDAQHFDRNDHRHGASAWERRLRFF